MNNSKSATDVAFQIVIVGGGAAGIAVASSLLSRNNDLQIAIIDPADYHYYQPGFTMVGAGVFTPEEPRRTMKSVMPRKVTWIKRAVTRFEPDAAAVVLDDDTRVSYERLIVCPGLKLNWEGIEGLTETLGKNSVTSNYRADLAPYTWQLVQKLKSGKALFTQPPMPIKCAGAPQKVLYLSADHWMRQGLIERFDIRFYNAGAVLFGVKEYVPALQSYLEKYRASLLLSHNLIKVNGETRTAWFKKTDADGTVSEVETNFDMLHVCPPQTAPDFIRSSPLTDAAGWVDVDQYTMQHKRYPNIWGLGDVTNTPNAKTAAAVRKQAPIVASNIISDMQGKHDFYAYDGYGSCPLTVERGKIVLAEFGYGGELQPTFPKWVINGSEPTAAAWFLKKSILPAVYWHGMLKGHEWMVKPSKKAQP